MVQINNDLCISCGRCADNCAVHALFRQEDGTYRCGNLLCFNCGQCVAICPSGAISMPELEQAIEYTPAAFDLNAETLLNAMRFRRSIRRFTGEKLSREELDMLLEAGRCAPTSSNTQSVQFTVLDQEFEQIRPLIWESFGRLTEDGPRKRLHRRYEQYLANPDQPDTMFYGATQMIAVTAPNHIDGGLALANMELLAHAMGLGALYCGFASHSINQDEQLRQYFGVSENRHLSGCLVLGRTDLRFHRTAPRKPPQVNWK